MAYMDSTAFVFFGGSDKEDGWHPHYGQAAKFKWGPGASPYAFALPPHSCHLVIYSMQNCLWRVNRRVRETAVAYDGYCAADVYRER